MKFSFKKIKKSVTVTFDKFLSYLMAPAVQRVAILLAVVLFTTSDIFAQGAATGGAGFSSATTTIQGYQDMVSNLMKAIGAIIAIVGAFNVYYKMQNGDQDVKKTIMLTIGGCVAFVALSEALPMFFN